MGLRLALPHPERITAIISQNGNTYEEGQSQDWNPIQKYRHAIRNCFSEPRTSLLENWKTQLLQRAQNMV